MWLKEVRNMNDPSTAVKPLLVTLDLHTHRKQCCNYSLYIHIYKTHTQWILTTQRQWRKADNNKETQEMDNSRTHADS